MLKYLGYSFLSLILFIMLCFALSLIEFTNTNKYIKQKQIEKIVKLDTLYTDIDFIGKNVPYGVIIENVELNETESLYRLEYHDSKDNLHQITFRSFSIYNKQDTIYFTNQNIINKNRKNNNY